MIWCELNEGSNAALATCSSLGSAKGLSYRSKSTHGAAALACGSVVLCLASAAAVSGIYILLLCDESLSKFELDQALGTWVQGDSVLLIILYHVRYG